MIERDIVERPESVLALLVAQNGTVLLIEEDDLGAETQQLTIPGGKVTDPTPEGMSKPAEIEQREDTGYCPVRLEKLLDFSSHPGYITRKVNLFVVMTWSGNHWTWRTEKRNEKVLCHPIIVTLNSSAPQLAY